MTMREKEVSIIDTTFKNELNFQCYYFAYILGNIKEITRPFSLKVMEWNVKYFDRG